MAGDPDNERHWNSEGQRWVYPGEADEALDAAELAITEYHNGDRAWAEEWLLRAHEANQEKANAANVRDCDRIELGPLGETK